MQLPTMRAATCRAKLLGWVLQVEAYVAFAGGGQQKQGEVKVRSCLSLRTQECHAIICYHVDNMFGPGDA